jgi:pimeloyl-ACP methyl ester carboxylesterase
VDPAELLTRPGNELALAPGVGATGITPQSPTGAQAVIRALMLSHGYCSGGNVWPLADFSGNRIVFSDPNQNRTNDAFALLMRQQAGDVRSFGVVGHSQGGLAALHLLTYYTSGLERATGGRPIQSVASPYQGTPLASLGGFACGVNNDMTPAGAATWLAGIPSWARAQVDYYSTANSGAVCNFLASLVLSDPEDGVVEMVGAQLPGANNMGHITGWCHTTGMSDPASYTDHARNVLLDATAAR